eukprot:TRINITY_DN28963_c0_g2_i1.p1 TRINITY_DN28963_c0_g2~~TRINITY_DN28963_c0_g2_i1.p1  ORF type:complete len:361 (-),score=42.51 TRINITY_DN28963_c0_g2_i1:68-1150(-)
MIAVVNFLLHTSLLHTLAEGVRVPAVSDSKKSPSRYQSAKSTPSTGIKSDNSSFSCSVSDNGTRIKKLPVKIETYTLTTLLGRGSEGDVYKGTTEDGHDVAVKVMDIKRGKAEASVMRSLQKHDPEGHPNILKIQDMILREDNAFIVTEFADGGDLHTYNVVERSFEEKRQLSRELVEGLSYCHRHGVYHGDIKFDNLFVKHGVLKIGDFGMSTIVGNQTPIKSNCGTLDYLAPEIWGRRPHMFEPDVWAAGVTLFAMFTGKAPFRVENNVPQFGKPIRWGRIEKYRHLMKLLNGMLEKDQTKRWTIEQVKKSTFLIGTSERRNASTTKQRHSSEKKGIQIGGGFADALLRRAAGVCCIV